MESVTSNICEGIAVNADFDQKNFKGLREKSN